MSVPAPPSMLSAPAPPTRLSLPAPPKRTLALASPISVSLKPEPVRFSILLSTSPAASPPVLLLPLTVTFTPAVEAE